MPGSRSSGTPARRTRVQHRAGRAIALSRVVLASVFLLAIYVDPSQPAAAPEQVYLLLACYVVVALGVAAVAFSSWWWDHRLARAMHVADLLVFAVVVYATEGYTSPFFTFSLFLLLSAAIRWGGQETVRTAIAVNLLFLLAGMLSGLLMTTALDVQRVLIRSTYLVVLSLLFSWFVFDRDRMAERSSLHKRLRGTTDVSNLLQLICDHVAERVVAERILCVSRDEGEPWDQVCEQDNAGVSNIEKGREEVAGLLAVLPDEPFLFEPGSGRLLTGTAQSARSIAAPEVLRRFTGQRGLPPSLGIPVRSDEWNCVVFVAGMRALSVDDLTTGAELAEEIAFIQKQSLFNHLSEQATSNRTRLSIGRDLHDSVAQLLAGVSFRLEGFKGSGKAALELAEEIDVLQDELASEQRQLRSLIADLRRPGAARGGVDISSSLSGLTERLGRQWNIDCAFIGPTGLQVRSEVERELNQMLREGVANAVRHGRADTVSIRLQAADPGIELEIVDNGGPLAESPGGQIEPRTLKERAEAMGGALEANSTAHGTRVRIVLPIGATP